MCVWRAFIALGKEVPLLCALPSLLYSSVVGLWHTKHGTSVAELAERHGWGRRNEASATPAAAAAVCTAPSSRQGHRPTCRLQQ